MEVKYFKEHKKDVIKVLLELIEVEKKLQNVIPEFEMEFYLESNHIRIIGIAETSFYDYNYTISKLYPVDVVNFLCGSIEQEYKEYCEE